MTSPLVLTVPFVRWTYALIFASACLGGGGHEPRIILGRDSLRAGTSWYSGA